MRGTTIACEIVILFITGKCGGKGKRVKADGPKSDFAEKGISDAENLGKERAGFTRRSAADKSDYFSGCSMKKHGAKLELRGRGRAEQGSIGD